VCACGGWRYIVLRSTWLGSLPLTVALELTFPSRPDTIVPFLPFITVALAGMVVASVGSDVGRRKLRMESSLERRADVADVDCTDIPTSTFLYHS